MRLTLWGTRGSMPSPAPETLGYGGNTASVEVCGSDGSVIVLDAGTGIRRLGPDLDMKVTRVDILLTHLHMDHIQGLGFFPALFRPDLEVHIWGPPSTTQDLRSRLTRYLSPPLFPVHLRELPSRITLHDVPLGRFQLGGLNLQAALVCHPGPTVGYRITDHEGSVAYLPDHEPALGARVFPDAPEWTSGFALADGVDILIHDAQYTLEEYPQHVGWGHSAIEHAVAFAVLTRARRLIAFHHDPAHDDETLDRLLAAAGARAPRSLQIIAGREGLTFEV